MYIHSFSSAMREKFGTKVYKLALSGGMTCPNRDGRIGTGGCIFCGSRGAGEFASPKCADLSAQIARAKEKVAFKAGNCQYIAYFQDYTNTYAPVEYLRSLFLPIIEREDIAALSIATRPDCLPDEVLRLLEELQAIKPVWIEFGLQTIHERSAAYIRRGYPLSTYEEAMRNLKTLGAETVVHQIIGLPGESENEIYETSSYIAHSGADGIKLHLLYVIRGTDLEKDYRAGKFETLSEEKYIRLLSGCIERIPREIILHRITGDAAKRELISPLWSADKKRVLADIQAYFVQNDITQGRLFK